MQKQRFANGTSFEVFGQSKLPVVILIHGLELCKSMWRDFIPYFLEDYRVVTFDLYGHGASSPLESEFDLAFCAAQINKLLVYLNIKSVHLIGFSIGGMINRKFEQIYPNKVLSLIILNSPHKREEALQRTVERRAKLVNSQGALATLDDAITRWFTVEFISKHPDVIAWIKEWRKTVHEKSYAQIAWILAIGVEELINQKINKTPALIITSESDSGSTPSMAVEIGKEYLYSDVIVVPKLKHLGLLEAPKAFAHPILRFLERVK